MRNWHIAFLGVLALVIAAALQAQHWSWVVEDAAISFAYARNWAEGHGLVAFQGMERVEGYSNPLWVVLLAGAHLLGVDLFDASRWLGVILLGVTLPAVWSLGRRAGAGALALVLVATSGSLAIWSASGLENSLYLALLALALALLVGESEADHRRPWSSVVFLGLALTRPEGMMYAVAGGMWITAVRIYQRQSLRWVLVWWAVLLSGLGLFFLIRWYYFAFPLPATYYAKLGAMKPRFLDWNARGWTQLRDWSLDTGALWMLPVMVSGITGWKGWRGAAGMGLVGLLGGVLLAPGPEFLHGIGPWPVSTPEHWDTFRWIALGLVAVLVPLLGLGRPGWKVTSLCWGMALCTVFFALQSDGDWMRGYRFLSPAAVTLPVLIAIGMVRIGDALRPSRTDLAWGLRSFVALGLLLPLWVVPNIQMVTEYQRPTSPWGVKRRLDFYKTTFNRLELDRPFLAVDHDMGGMMWWTHPLEGYVIDAKGLVNVPFSLHHTQRDFVREFLFEQRTFDLAHTHASTGQAVRRIPEFRQEYIEVPGYPSGRNIHDANYLRRDLFLRTDRLPEGPSATFGGIEVVGVHIPAPKVGPDSGLFVEIGVRTRIPHRMLVFVARQGGEELVLWDVPPGYDWIDPTQWRQGEAFVGRFSFPIPVDLPLGSYDLGVVVFDEGGEILPADRPASSPRVARGEARFPALVQIVSRREMLDIAAMWRDRAIEAAGAGDCEEGEAHWEIALRTRTRSAQWQRENRPMTARAIGRCWSKRAAGEPTFEAVAWVERARRWDPLTQHVEYAGQVVADALWPEARQARSLEDHERAFRLLDGIARANPSEAFARRWAEEARAQRLGLAIGGVGIEGADEERQEEVRRQRQSRAATERLQRAEARARGRAEREALAEPKAGTKEQRFTADELEKEEAEKEARRARIEERRAQVEARRAQIEARRAKNEEAAGKEDRRAQDR